MVIEHRPVVLAIFVLTYAGMAIGRVPGLKLNRVGFALLGAICMMVFSGTSADGMVSRVNWPTILLLFGFFVISSQLQLSGFYGRVAERVSLFAGKPSRFLLVLMAVTGGLSAFLNHDIICYVFTPVVAAALLRRRLNPAPFLIGLAISSNIGATATLVGSAQGILIGEVAHLGFWRYFLWSAVPVALAMAAAYGLVLMAVSRPGPDFAPIDVGEPDVAYPFDRRHTAKGLVILGAVIALFFTPVPKEIIVLVAAAVHLASPKFRTEDLLALVDWQILVLFMSLFIVTGTFAATGYGESAVRWLEGAGFDPGRPANEALMTVGLAALLNNAPAVMLLVKIIPLASPSVAYVLSLANGFGGNVILTASVSNIIVVQQARRQGIAISFRDFARIGLPVTAAAVAILVGWVALAGR